MAHLQDPILNADIAVVKDLVMMNNQLLLRLCEGKVTAIDRRQMTRAAAPPVAHSPVMVQEPRSGGSDGAHIPKRSSRVPNLRQTGDDEEMDCIARRKGSRNLPRPCYTVGMGIDAEELPSMQLPKKSHRRRGLSNKGSSKRSRWDDHTCKKLARHFVDNPRAYRKGRHDFKGFAFIDNSKTSKEWSAGYQANKRAVEKCCEEILLGICED